MNSPALRTAPESVLLITLDSCRYDTFVAADAPGLKALGRVHRAMAPSYFTFGSHAAIFVGFTPGVADARESFVNPKFGKLFKLAGTGFPAKGREHIVLQGRNLADGFRKKGVRTLGTGAVGWFDPGTDTGQVLTRDFEEFFYPGDSWSLGRQVDWLLDRISEEPSRPVFAFLNVGETHVPYYHEGAGWDLNTNPCIPFGDRNDPDECRRRQRLCLEFADRTLARLLAAFEGRTVVACGDHGDCWGEDGLWEHGIHHPKVLEVPLVFRLGDGPGGDPEAGRMH